MTEPGSHRLVDALVEGAAEALIAATADGTVRAWNWGAENTFGWPAAEAVGRRLVDLCVPPEEAEATLASLREALETGSAVFESECRRRDGGAVHVQVVMKRLDADGATPLVTIAARDVSEARRLERQLFDQIWSLTDMQALLHGVLDASAGHAIVATDLEGRVKVWSEGAARMTGRSAAEAAETDLKDALVGPGPDARERLAGSMARALASGSAELALLCSRADGTVFPARATVNVRRAHDHAPVGFVVVAQDVTAAEEGSRALARKTSFVELLQEVAVAANESTSVEDAMQRALDAVCRHTGWPVGHVYVRGGAWSGGLVPTTIWHIDDPDAFETFRHVTEATEFAPGVGLPGRVLQRGGPVWIEDVERDDNFPRAGLAPGIGVRGAFGFPVLVASEIVAVLEFFSKAPQSPDADVLDVMGHVGAQLGRVVERRRAEEEHRTSVERLMEIERLTAVGRFKEQFLRTISHELNTPLTPLRINLHLLGTGDLGPLNERQAKAVDVLSRNVRRLQLLVQDMLDVARIQAGHLLLQRMPVHLGEVVSEALDLFEEQARTAGVLLERRLGASPMVDADPRRIQQVVINLVGNALKFTQRGGRIQASLEVHGDEAVVAVRDTGPGLQQEQVARLFQPFSQVHDPTQLTAAGTGLGLYICRAILEEHGGRIWCESPGPGAGSTFAFALPVARVDASTGDRPVAVEEDVQKDGYAFSNITPGL